MVLPGIFAKSSFFTVEVSSNLSGFFGLAVALGAISSPSSSVVSSSSGTGVGDAVGFAFSLGDGCGFAFVSEPEDG